MMRRRFTSLAPAVAVLLAGSAHAAPGLDAFGEDVRRAAPPETRPAAAPGARPKSLFRVGLDARNAFDAAMLFSDGIFYEELRALLVARGATLVPLATFEAADLAGLHSIFLAHPHAGSGYSPSEIAAVHAFVAGGGRAVACAEAATGSESYVANMNELVAPWGVAFSPATSEGAGHVVTSLTAHPVTANVSSYGIDYQRRIVSFAPPATDLSSGSGADDTLAAVDASPGQGCVVIVADQSSFTDAGSGGDYDLGTLDNAALLGNIVGWFRSQACGEPPPCDAAAVLTGPAELCEGVRLDLDASGSGIPGCAGALEHRWLRDGLEIEPWGPLAAWSEAATVSATYGVEIRCTTDLACTDSAAHAVAVIPGAAPPALPNLLLATKRGDGILFTWQDTGAFGHRLRSGAGLPFDRAGSRVLATISGAFEHFEPGELDRPPRLIFYRVFAVSCAGSEEP